MPSELVMIIIREHIRIIMRVCVGGAAGGLAYLVTAATIPVPSLDAIPKSPPAPAAKATRCSQSVPFLFALFLAGVSTGLFMAFLATFLVSAEDTMHGLAAYKKELKKRIIMFRTIEAMNRPDNRTDQKD